MSFTHPLPLLSRPWRPLVCQSLPLLSRRDICRDLDITSHCTEQLSCADVIAMATESRDSHMISDDVIRPWWACPAEDSVLDEFSVMGECVWREREVNRAICEEVEGGGVRGGWGEVGEKRNDPENITLKKK